MCIKWRGGESDPLRLLSHNPVAQTEASTLGKRETKLRCECVRVLIILLGFSLSFRIYFFNDSFSMFFFLIRHPVTISDMWQYEIFWTLCVCFPCRYWKHRCCTFILISPVMSPLLTHLVRHSPTVHPWRTLAWVSTSHVLFLCVLNIIVKK